MHAQPLPSPTSPLAALSGMHRHTLGLMVSEWSLRPAPLRPTGTQRHFKAYGLWAWSNLAGDQCMPSAISPSAALIGTL